MKTVFVISVMHDNGLARAMERLTLNKSKNSITGAFLREVANLDNRSKAYTRLQYARAKNRQRKASQNIRKLKERMKELARRMREHESELDAATEDVARLKNLLGEDEHNAELSSD